MKHYSPTGRRKHGRFLKRPERVNKWPNSMTDDTLMMIMMMMMMSSFGPPKLLILSEFTARLCQCIRIKKFKYYND
jgi:hypothetical protein